jgi:hypothetical protein
MDFVMDDQQRAILSASIHTSVQIQTGIIKLRRPTRAQIKGLKISLMTVEEPKVWAYGDDE